MLKRGKQLKRTPLKKRSQKAKESLEENIQQQKQDKCDDITFYKALYMMRGSKCQVTGQKLYPFPSLLYFHHLFRKETYPEYRHEEWNVIIVSPEVHEKCERMGNEWHPTLQKLYLEALKEHRKFVENNYDGKNLGREESKD